MITIPVIESIDFGRTKIRINGTGYDHVDWYFDNRIVHTGDSFDYFRDGSDEIFYVYFIAYTSDFSIENGTGALIGSQPFWVLNNR